MNREEKRDYIKKLRKQGRSDQEIIRLIELKERSFVRKPLDEGDKVKIDVEKIKSRKDYENMRNEYKLFIENNTNVIFTVEFDPKYQDHTLVVLKEDETKPKWLWWEGDLKRL